jgi:hypothetical protein
LGDSDTVLAGVGGVVVTAASVAICVGVVSVGGTDASTDCVSVATGGVVWLTDLTPTERPIEKPRTSPTMSMNAATTAKVIA